MKRTSLLHKCAAFVSFAALLGMNFNISSLTIKGMLLLLILVGAAVFYFPAPAFPNWKQSSTVWAILVCVGCSTNLYDSLILTGIVSGIQRHFGMDTSFPLAAASLCAAAAAVPAASWLIEAFSSAIRTTWQKSMPEGSISWKKAFTVLFAAYTVGILPLIQANFYYMDDIGRVTYGYKQFRHFGRHVSAAMSNYLHMDTYLADCAPLTQLVAAAFLALTAIVILRVITGRNHFSLWELLAAVPIGLNPYFLECFSYRYDSPYMAFSLLAAAFPLLIGSDLLYFLAAAVGTLLVCSSYQASSGIFPMLVMILVLQKWCRKESFALIWHFVWVSIAGFGAGVVAFQLAFMPSTNAEYVATSLPAAKDMLPTLLFNYKGFFSALLSDFPVTWLLAALGTAIAFIWHTLNVSRQPKAITICLTFLTLVFMLLICFGLYPALANTLFAPRAMYGFCVFLGLLSIVAASEKKLIAHLPTLILCWSFFVFCFIYGNALSNQKDYTDYRIQQVIADLDDLSVSKEDPELEIQFTGSIGQAPSLRNMPESYQLLDKLVPETFAGGNDWNYLRFFYFFDLENAIPRQDLTELDLPPMEDHMLHTIYGDGHRFLIHLK